MHSFEIFISLHVLNNKFFSICMVYWSPSSSLLFALITLQSVKGAGSIKKNDCKPFPALSIFVVRDPFKV